MRRCFWLVMTVLSLCVENGVAGTNLVKRVIEDDRDRDGQPEMRAEKYFHGTNEVLEICRMVRERGVTRSVGSDGGPYSITLRDYDDDGIFESIMISLRGGDVLEILKREPDGNYRPTPQRDLDELNRETRKLMKSLSRSGAPPDRGESQK